MVKTNFRARGSKQQCYAITTSHILPFSWLKTILFGVSPSILFLQ